MRRASCAPPARPTRTARTKTAERDKESVQQGHYDAALFNESGRGAGDSAVVPSRVLSRWRRRQGVRAVG